MIVMARTACTHGMVQENDCEDWIRHVVHALKTWTVYAPDVKWL